MRQPVGQVRFKFGVSGIAETRAELGVVIGQDFRNPCFLVAALPVIGDIRVKKGGQFQPGISGFNQAVIIHRFGNRAGGKKGMVFLALAEPLPVFQHIVYDGTHVFCRFILRIRHIILNAFLIGAVFRVHARHRHLVHKAVVDFFLFIIGKYFAFICRFGLLQGDGSA